MHTYFGSRSLPVSGDRRLFGHRLPGAPSFIPGIKICNANFRAFQILNWKGTLPSGPIEFDVLFRVYWASIKIC